MCLYLKLTVTHSDGLLFLFYPHVFVHVFAQFKNRHRWQIKCQKRMLCKEPIHQAWELEWYLLLWGITRTK